jgi:hypothetical protein
MQRKPSATPSTPTASSITAYSTTRPKQNEVYEDYSEAVENWRQKREQKRKQSLTSNLTENDPPTPSPSYIQSSPPPPSPIKRFDEPKPKPKSTQPPPPPPPQTKTVVSSPLKTNISTGQLSAPNRKESKSPSPQRIKGPAKIREISIQKPIEIRGFGFKLDGGPAQNRPIYISSLEDGSPADKAGLCIDDEIISMNDEYLEHMTFDQVRKILKERNLRGSIKLIVKTYDDTVEDTSQTVTTGPTTEHSRTPSPQKPLSNPPASSISTTSTIRVSSTTPPNVQSPVYTFLPYTPPPSSNPTADKPIDIPVNQTPAPSLNIFAPKPFRSTASISLDTPNNNEKTTTNVEQSSSPVTKSTSRDVVNTLLSNPTLISSNIIDSSLSRTNNPKPPPPPLTSVESLLHGTSNLNSNDQQRNESPIAQVRSSVEKQMNQLQQELLLGFPHTPTSREQRPVSIPIDLTNATIPKPSIMKSSSLNQQQDPNYHQTRIYGVHANPNENTTQYSESNNQQWPVSSYAKRSAQDVPSTNRPLTAHSTDRTVNELRVNLSSPSTYQQQKKVSLQIDEKIPEQQRLTNKQLHTTLNQAPKKSHYDDHSWITDDQRKSMMTTPPPPPASQLSSYNNGRNNNDRRSASSTSHYPDLERDRQPPKELTMFHYGDHTDEPHHHHHHHHYQQHSRSTQQQKDFDPSTNRHYQSKHRTKSPVRTTINSNNNRVLSVSGKLRCSKCNDELGQGSAMVIESLGLYYHIECFRCFVCNIPLSSSFEGTDVRVRSNRLHCQNCFSDENGAWRSNV